MVEEQEKIKKRTDYGTTEGELSFETDEESDWLNVPSDYASIIDNPIYKTLSEFKKTYIKNEVFALELFRQLNESFVEFDEMIDNYDYADMDIVKKMKILLNQYRTWSLALRQNIFLSKEKMSEVLDIHNNYYVSKKRFEDFKDEAEEALAESEKGHKITLNIDNQNRFTVPSKWNWKKGDKIMMKKISGDGRES